MSDLRRFKPYPAYRHSGVEWLGDTPTHWKTERLKYVAPIADERFHELDSDLPYVGLEHVESGTGRLTAVAAGQAVDSDETEGVASIFRPGDVLFGKLRPYLAKVLRPEFEGRCSTELLVLRSSDRIASSLLAYQMLSRDFIGWVNAMTYGTKMPRANPDQVMNIRIAIPPSDEQRPIAVFLDRNTARIDALLARKERLIELLHEGRAALITQAVTSGLDPNVPMKDSGVEWLGRIPAHWELVRLGRKIVLQRGEDITKNEQHDGAVPVVSSGGISSFHDKPFATGPGVIVGRKGTAGAVYYVEPDFWPHDTTLWVKEFGGNNRRYVFYKLSSMDLASFDTGTANPTLNRNLIHPVVTCWPPVEEQVAIAVFLDRETEKTDARVAKITEAIDRLNELRTALISAAVTGKIDVRTATEEPSARQNGIV